MDVGSISSARKGAAETVDASRTQPVRKAQEDGAIREAGGRDVEISREARQLHASRDLGEVAESRAAEARARRAPSEAQRAERQERNAAQEARAAREFEAPRPEAAPQIAVRTGPLSIDAFSEGLGVASDAERALAESLNGRARLLNLDKVLAEPARPGTRVETAPSETSSERSAAETSGTPARDVVDPELILGNGGERVDLPLLGEDRRVDTAAGSAATRTAPLPEPEPAHVREPDSNRTDAAQQRAEGERQRIERNDGLEDQARAAAVASHSGGVTPPPASSGAESVAAENLQRSRVAAETADRAFSQAGVVEASTQDQLATRYVANLPAPDPGPEPSPREVLGQRNRG